jgi:hypothetical protein
MIELLIPFIFCTLRHSYGVLGFYIYGIIGVLGIQQKIPLALTLVFPAMALNSEDLKRFRKILPEFVESALYPIKGLRSYSSGAECSS